MYRDGRDYTIVIRRRVRSLALLARRVYVKFILRMQYIILVRKMR